MALTNKPAATVTLKWRDGQRDVAFTKLHVPFATALADILAGGNAIGAAAAALSDCSLRGYDITFSHFENAPVAAVATARAERKGIFEYLLANGLTAGFSIPSPKQAILDENGFINTANSLVLAVDAAVLTVGGFCGLDGSDMIQLLRAYEIGRSTGKSQRP